MFLGLHFFSFFSFASGFTPLGFHVVGLYFFGVSFGFASGLAPLGFLWS